MFFCITLWAQLINSNNGCSFYYVNGLKVNRVKKILGESGGAYIMFLFSTCLEIKAFVLIYEVELYICNALMWKVAF